VVFESSLASLARGAARDGADARLGVAIVTEVGRGRGIRLRGTGRAPIWVTGMAGSGVFGGVAVFKQLGVSSDDVCILSVCRKRCRIRGT
jgi:hypothetical protein